MGQDRHGAYWEPLRKPVMNLRNETERGGEGEEGRNLGVFGNGRELDRSLANTLRTLSECLETLSGVSTDTSMLFSRMKTVIIPTGKAN